VLDQHVIEAADEVPGQFLLVGVLGDQGLPCAAEILDEIGERRHQRLVEQPGLGAEVPEQQVLGDARRIGDLSGGGAAVILAGEQVSRGIQ